jgi:hypothetical protein
MPLAFPRIVLSSMMLSSVPGATMPMPKLLACAANPFPAIRFRRSRLPREAPDSHMPPHGLVLFPLRTEMLSSTSLAVAPVMKMPDKQLVDAVTWLTRTRVLPPLI